MVNTDDCDSWSLIHFQPINGNPSGMSKAIRCLSGVMVNCFAFIRRSDAAPT
jgi:hypothetical protein